MKRVWFVLLASMLLAINASAQTSASSQSSASVKSNTSASAGKSGVQAQSSTSANVSQETKASREQSGKKGSKAQASGSGSGAASAQAGQSSASLSSGATIDAVLTHSLDARKNHEGDQVTARTTEAVKSEGHVVVPKGCKLIGHVTQAKARAKGESESALGIVFDRALLKNGQEIPLNVTIQALAEAQSAASASLGNEDVMGSAGAMGSGAVSGGGGARGGLLGGAGSAVGAAAGSAVGETGAVTGAAGQVGSTAGGAVGSTVNTAAGATGAVGGLNAAGRLTSNSSGVFGLKGLSLSSEASNATQGSVIVSSTKNVHLDSGTQMLLRVKGQ